MGTIRTLTEGATSLTAFRAPRLRHQRRQSLPSALLATLLLWQERAVQRRALREMEAYRLEDLGISRSEALREADKPFWRP